MNEILKELCARLETSAKESEQGRNFAGTPHNCRQAVLAMQGQSILIDELMAQNKALVSGMGKIDALLGLTEIILQATHGEHQTGRQKLLTFEPIGEEA